MPLSRVTIPLGHQTCSFDVPSANLADVLEPNPVTIPPDGDTVIAHAIAHPIGCAPLPQLVHGSRQVIIIVDDLTRPTPAHRAVPIVLDLLNSAGIADHQIKVVVALGTHRPMTEPEIIARVGAAVVQRVAVVNSNFSGRENLKDCGVAADGTRLWVDRQVMDGDFRIGVGTILPHPTAGWGGGAKIIYPGVGGEETVSHFHLQQTLLTRNVFGDITSPIRANMEKWVGELGLHFIVNVICTPGGQIYKAVAGHFIEAHRQGVEAAKEVCAVRVSRRADIVIAGSYPADLDFWQASKALTSADHLVTDGGTVILVTPCPEGIGPHDELADYVGDDDPDALAARAFAGQTADPVAVAGGVTLARMRRRARYAIVSDGLSPAVCARMKMGHYGTAQAALDAALSEYGPGATVSVIPHGAELLPIVQEA